MEQENVNKINYEEGVKFYSDNRQAYLKAIQMFDQTGLDSYLESLDNYLIQGGQTYYDQAITTLKSLNEKVNDLFLEGFSDECQILIDYISENQYTDHPEFQVAYKFDEFLNQILTWKEHISSVTGVESKTLTVKILIKKLDTKHGIKVYKKQELIRKESERQEKLQQLEEDQEETVKRHGKVENQEDENVIKEAQEELEKDQKATDRACCTCAIF